MAIEDGKSWGRKTDGGSEWVIFDAPTIGASNGAAPQPEGKLALNEVSCGEKKFEIYNGTSKEIDIAGYVFKKDDSGDWAVPEGKGKIPSKGFLVFTAKNPDINEGPSFGLSGTKGFKLTMLDKDGKVIDELDNSASVEGFKTLEDTETIGRKTDGDGEWIVFSACTIGSSNSKGTAK